MDIESDPKSNQRKYFFSHTFDEESLKDKRTEHQVQLRRDKRSDQAFKARKLKEFEIDWIEIDKKADCVYNVHDLGDYVQALSSKSDKIILMGVHAIRTLLTNRKGQPTDEIMGSGALDYLIKFLCKHDCPQIQYESAWAITNMCQRTDHVNILIEKGCLKGFLYMLSSTVAEVKEQAIWALANVVASSSYHRDLVVQQTLGLLIRVVMESSVVSIIQRGCVCLSNICISVPPPSPDVCTAILPVLAKGVLMHADMREELQFVLASISVITEVSKKAIEQLLGLDILKLIIKFCSTLSYPYAYPAVKIIGNVIGSTDAHAQAVVKAGAVEALQYGLRSKNKLLRKEAIWAVSNLCAGTLDQVRILLNSGMIKEILDISIQEDLIIQKEIAWVLGNALSNDSDFVPELIDIGILDTLMYYLGSRDFNIVIIALMSIEKVLEFCSYDPDYRYKCLEVLSRMQGQEAIIKLQFHKNIKIQEKAIGIMNKYFYDLNQPIQT
jgi:Importin beta binding domain/Armadillo/beta-catenin-like repeat